MAKPYTQDVVLDAQGKPLFDAVDTLARKIEGIQRTIAKIQSDSFKSAKDFNTTLDANVKQLQKASQQLSTLQRQDASERARMRALAAADARQNANRYGTNTTRVGYEFEREKAILALRAASSEKERVTALKNLELANARLKAIQAIAREEERAAAAQISASKADNLSGHRARLALARANANESARMLGTEQALEHARLRQVNAERALAAASAITRNERLQALQLANAELRAVERLVAAEARAGRVAGGVGGAGGGPPGSRISNILTPAYAGAAFARTSIYGVAAMGAYGAFNTAQAGFGGAVQLEDELKRLQAIANATDAQMQTLKASIIGVAEGSRYAINDLVKISQLLAQAGVSAGQMEAVLRSVTALATASGSTPDEAANLVTSALGSFQLHASEAARIADLMTEALNRTKLTVQQVGQAIQYVGATAYEQNISLEQLLATIGSVAQAGVKSGSTIGTGFRQFLVDLQEPSKKLTEQLERLGLSAADIDVSVRGLPAVLDTLRQAGFGAAQAYEGLEVRAAAFYLTAKNNVDIADQLQLSFAHTNASIVAQERAMDSLAAQWQRFKNIILVDFAAGIDPLLGMLKDLLRNISNSMDGMEDAAAKLEQRRAGGLQGYMARDGAVLGFLKYEDENLVRDMGKAVYNLQNALLDLATPQFYAGGKGLGQMWDEYIQGTVTARQTSEDLATKISDTADAIESQKTRVGELDKEIVRLITQKESLRHNDVRAAAETATLTSRFVGLSNQLVITGNRYDDLVNAAKRYRLEQLRLMGVELATQQMQVNSAIQSGRGQLNTNLRGVQGNTGLMKLLTPQERSALAQVGNNPVGSQQFSTGHGILAAAVDRLSKTNKHMSDVLQAAITPAGALSQNVSLRNTLAPTAGQVAFMQTPIGAQLTNTTMQLTSIMERLSSADRGSASFKQLTSQADTLLDAAEAAVAKRLPIARGATVGGLNAVSAELQSFRQQLRAATAATADEVKAAQKAAKAEETAERKAQREAERGPVLTQQGFDDIIKSVTSKPLGSGQRSAAEQDSYYRRGLTPASSRTSAHTTGGLVRDIRTGPMSKEEGDRLAETVRQAFKARGITVIAKFETGVGRNQGTGPHVHVQGAVGQRLRGGIGGKDPGEAEFKYDTQLDQAQLELDRAAMADKLKDIASATTQTVFDASVVEAQAAMEKVNASIMTAALNELANAGVGDTSPMYQVKMQQVMQAIAQNREAFERAIVDGIIKRTETLFKAANQAFENATQPAQRAVAMLQGAASGLDRYSLRGQVPDSTRQLLDARIAQAQETSDRSRLAALPTLIGSQQAALNAAQTALDQKNLDPARVAEYTLRIAELQSSIEGLKTTRDSLAAAFGAEGLLPKTLGEGLQQAVAAYKELNNLNLTFTQMVNGEMLGAINTLHGALTNMFVSIMDGSRTALQAIGDFAKAIMAAIMQIIAKILATQIIKLLFSLFAPGQPLPPGLQGGGEAPPPEGAYNGKAIRGYSVGNSGPIIDGHSMRDNVLSRLAKGEWVIRKAAVDSVGHEFMNNLNRNGARALEDTKKLPKIEMRPRQEVNVWMVKPEDKPQMGPNDVLVTWQQDVLSGGESKRLIQHVARES